MAPTTRNIVPCSAWEILESRHGRLHPDVGAACVSLGNLAVIRHKHGEASDWFKRALGTFEVSMYTLVEADILPKRVKPTHDLPTAGRAPQQDHGERMKQGHTPTHYTPTYVLGV